MSYKVIYRSNPSNTVSVAVKLSPAHYVHAYRYYPNYGTWEHYRSNRKLSDAEVAILTVTDWHEKPYIDPDFEMGEALVHNVVHGGWYQLAEGLHI